MTTGPVAGAGLLDPMGNDGQRQRTILRLPRRCRRSIREYLRRRCPNNERIQKFDNNGIFLLQRGEAPVPPTASSINPKESPSIALPATFSWAIFSIPASKSSSPNGSFIRTWGTSGSGNGQFTCLRGVAVDSLGNLYTTDARLQLARPEIRQQQGIISTQCREASEAATQAVRRALGDRRRRRDGYQVTSTSGTIPTGCIKKAASKEFDSNGNFLAEDGRVG